MRLNFKLKTCKSSMVKLFFFRYADMRRRRGQVLCCSFFMFACLAEVLKVLDFRIYFNCLKFSCDRSIEKCNILGIKNLAQNKCFLQQSVAGPVHSNAFSSLQVVQGFPRILFVHLVGKIGGGGHQVHTTKGTQALTQFFFFRNVKSFYESIPIIFFRPS